MDRREFISATALSLLAAPLAAEAQQAGKLYQVGVVSVGTDPARPAVWKPFIDAMADLHYVEGQNFVIKPAFAAGKSERLPELVAALVSAKVNVIVTTGTRETLAAKRATSSIPIVMLFVPDPIREGLVTSLAYPGGNVTGVTNLVPGLSQKWLELLREIMPSASRFAVIATPPNPPSEIRRELEDAARQLGVTLVIIPASGPEAYTDVLLQAKKNGVAGIIGINDGVTFLHRKILVQSALKYRLPGIYWTREYVDDGGLMTYGASTAAMRRHAATYVDKILRGAKPADLPVEQPTKFELVINLKTAKALGLTIPPSLLLRADEVIQ